MNNEPLAGDDVSNSDRLTDHERDRLDALVMRRLIAHLDAHKEAQNIDLMILAGFCRNCLAKWYKAAADDQGIDLSGDEAREHIYGMPYDEWKKAHQKPATQEQLAAMEKRQQG